MQKGIITGKNPLNSRTVHRVPPTRRGQVGALPRRGPGTSQHAARIITTFPLPSLPSCSTDSQRRREQGPSSRSEVSPRAGQRRWRLPRLHAAWLPLTLTAGWSTSWAIFDTRCVLGRLSRYLRFCTIQRSTDSSTRRVWSISDSTSCLAAKVSCHMFACADRGVRRGRNAPQTPGAAQLHQNHGHGMAMQSSRGPRTSGYRSPGRLMS